MTAKQHGMPGEWAKVRGTVLSLWPLFFCFIALGAFGAALVLGHHLLVFAGLAVLCFAGEFLLKLGTILALLWTSGPACSHLIAGMIADLQPGKKEENQEK